MRGVRKVPKVRARVRQTVGFMAKMLKLLLKVYFDLFEGDDTIFFWGMSRTELDCFCGCHNEGIVCWLCLTWLFEGLLYER